MTDESNFDLVMPWVTVASKGGPHDDDAYGCGWEMGRLDVQLESLPTGATGFAILVHTPNMPQVELIAMRWGWLVDAHELADGWTDVVLCKPGPES